MPCSSARSNASAVKASLSINFSLSSSIICCIAAFTDILRLRRCFGKKSPKILPILISAPFGISSIFLGLSCTSISTWKLSYFPLLKSSKMSFSNISLGSSPLFSFCTSTRMAAIFRSASICTRTSTSFIFSSFTRRIEHSTRSRIILSTSRPT